MCSCLAAGMQIRDHERLTELTYRSDLHKGAFLIHPDSGASFCPAVEAASNTPVFVVGENLTDTVKGATYMSSPWRVIIVGGGFGGLSAAVQALRSELVSRSQCLRGSTSQV